MKFGQKMALLRVFIALSLLSLFADITYEGARSIGGAYLNLLGAPALAAGILALGELLSNAMRFFGGFIAYKRPSPTIYWGLIFLGYGLNISIPFLALVGSWELALLLFFLERLGKGIRAPVRDVILAEVTEGFGRGKGFGIHEFLDQIGAITGPLVVSTIIFLRGHPAGYREAFWIMWIPTTLAMVMLLSAITMYPRPRAVAEVGKRAVKRRLSSRFWAFTSGTMAAMLGFPYWGIIAYYGQDVANSGIMAAGEIPLLYLVAMAVDASIAIPIGILYDKFGSRIIITAPATALLVTPILFGLGGRLGFYLAAVLWGLVMGVAETVMRAAVADMTTIEVRGLAYGVYSLGLGLSWMIGGTLLAYLYQAKQIYAIIILCAILEAAATLIFTIIQTPGLNPFKQRRAYTGR
ncbi:MAG: MFS transporter [Nitrososphaeria archaeon]|nr:MFS transporter [Nitrososphaeria archaeon]